MTVNETAPQGDFLKPALGFLFHKAGPGLPRDRQPGDDDEEKNDPKATQKSRPWTAFLKGRPWFAWRQETRDDDKKKTDTKAASKSRRWVAFLLPIPKLVKSKVYEG